MAVARDDDGGILATLAASRNVAIPICQNSSWHGS